VHCLVLTLTVLCLVWLVSPLQMRCKPSSSCNIGGGQLLHCLALTVTCLVCYLPALFPACHTADEVDAFLTKRGAQTEHEATLQVRACQLP
jgi:hypothetical protein